MVVNVETHTWLKGISVSGILNHRWNIQIIPLQGPGTIKEKGAKRWRTPDIEEDQSPTVSPRHRRAVACCTHEQDQSTLWHRGRRCSQALLTPNQGAIDS